MCIVYIIIFYILLFLLYQEDDDNKNSTELNMSEWWIAQFLFTLD